MGYYSEYNSKNLDLQGLLDLRKQQLQKLSSLRGGRDVLVYASWMYANDADSSIDGFDFHMVMDQLATMNGSKLDLILETPGGDGCVAEQIIKSIRNRYEELAIIVPGTAKSAGTIMAMGADEILMGPESALGPIDAQIKKRGEIISAHAFIDGIDRIAKSAESGSLNPSYIPMLQKIAPGEYESARRALDFGAKLVQDWLWKYKFKSWDIKESSKQPVKDEDRKKRAGEIADKLKDHGHWKLHNRSIMMNDLNDMKLEIIDFSLDKDLCETIQRYYALLQMTFQNSTTYKIIETPSTQLQKYTQAIGPQPASQKGPPVPHNAIDLQILDIKCNNCGHESGVQASFAKDTELQPGCIDFPINGIFVCPNCRSTHNINNVKSELESSRNQNILPSKNRPGKNTSNKKRDKKDKKGKGKRR